MKNTIFGMTFLFIIILGTFLRVYNLGGESLWYDEIGSVDQASRDLPSLFFNFFQDPPLYPFILRYWMIFFEASEMSIRSLSVIFAVGSLYLTYRVGQLLFNKRIALISVFLLALSPLHIFYSQEARYYSLSFFLALWSIFIFSKLLKKEANRYYYYLCIVNILLLYSNPLAIFIVLIENIFFLRRWNQKWTIIQGITFFLYMVWLYPMALDISKNFAFFYERAISWLPKASFKILADTFQAFNYGGPRFGGMDITLNYNNFSYAILLLNCMFAGLFIYALSLPFKKHKLRINFYFTLTWLVMPIACLFLFKLIYLPRYFLFCLPAYYFLISAGIDELCGKSTKIIATSLITGLLIAPLYVYYSQNLKIDWKDALDYVNADLEDNDTILVCPSKQLQLLGYYGKEGVRFYPNNLVKSETVLRENYPLIKGPYIFRNKHGITLAGINNVYQMKIIMSDHNFKGYLKNNNLWIITTRWINEIDKNRIIQYAKKFYSLSDPEKFQGLDVYFCTPLQ